MLRSAFLATLLAGITVAVPDDRATVSVVSKQTCVSKYRSALCTISPLPTNTTTAQDISSTVTTCGGASKTTSTITSIVSKNSHSGHSASVAFVSGREQSANTCSVTVTVTSETSTVYTGTYSRNDAKKTAGPPAQRSPNVENIFHIFRNGTIGGKQRALDVDYLDEMTTQYSSPSTISGELVTETVSNNPLAVYATLANIELDDLTAPVPITRTITAPEASNISNGTCTVTSAKSTTTQHLRCAPTNLISSVNGYGIGQIGGDLAAIRGLVPGGDPSACCQRCANDERCAASEDDADAGNCFLWYTNPSCGLGFEYSDGGQNLKPGSGFMVQTGCGTIEAVASF